MVLSTDGTPCEFDLFSFLRQLNSNIIPGIAYHSGGKYTDRLMIHMRTKRPLYSRPDQYSGLSTDQVKLHGSGRVRVAWPDP